MKPEDEECPELYGKAAKHIQHRRQVAKTAFRRYGMQIKSSIWNDDKELALMALKYLSVQLHNDKDLQLAAVRQNGLALAHVPYYNWSSHYINVVRTAILQNPAAAVFNEERHLQYFHYGDLSLVCDPTVSRPQ